MYHLTFYVPPSHLESVKNALFEAGAGHAGDYDRCAWQTLGTGQFRPLAGSAPFIGKTDQLEIVSEYKVEMVCEERCIQQALAALIASHPYQQPAYALVRMVTLDD